MRGVGVGDYIAKRRRDKTSSGQYYKVYKVSARIINISYQNKL